MRERRGARDDDRHDRKNEKNGLGPSVA